MQDNNTYEEDFEFFMPAQSILKADDGKVKDGKRWIQGVASTNARDLQGEVVIQDGIDFGYFLKNGYFNDDHKDGPEHKIGEPTKCKVTKDGLFVKGFLYQKQEKAGQYWDLIQAQESEADSQRKVGFSIQGKVVRRKGNVIERCWIQDIAITTAPINAKTWLDVVKSLSDSDWNKSQSSEDEDDDAEKALTAAGSASTLVPESLGEKLKVDRESPAVSKSLSFAETVSYVEALYGVDTSKASSIARVAFDLFGT